MKDHKKNNARTFRYSDEVAAILQQHNNDFDGLVLECFYNLPKVKEEKARIEKRKKELEHEWLELYNEIRELKTIKREIEKIETALLHLESEIL